MRCIFLPTMAMSILGLRSQNQIWLDKVVSYCGENPSIMAALVNRESDDPYFQFVLYGPSQSILEQVIDVCPDSNDSLDFPLFQWTWERASSSESWLKSTGWGCIFFINLFSRKVP
ncbi:MAG: hypothetical protein HRU19_31230 [Pseudobacteriovorax sp.]|nr:hypothetical protein [Pseudobacteriovorax sp.]